MDSKVEDIKKIKLVYEHELKYFILPHQNKNWEKNRHFLIGIKNGQTKGKDDLFQLFLVMHGVEVKNLIDVLKLKEEWITQFIPLVLPFIADLALRVEILFQEKEVLILQTEKREVNHLSREQVACLISNMFFLTLQPQLEHDNKLPETYDFKNWITAIVDKKRNISNQQKLICLLHYFWRVHQELKNKESSFSSQIITFERLVNENDDLLSKIEENDNKMSDIEIADDRGIETFEDFECLHCDFANKFLGGGVLRTGCVQEEIMFSASIELIAGMLFCERQKDNDAILITGTERFSEFKGYAEQFKFTGPHYHPNKLDMFNRKQTYVLAMNAISFKQKPHEQYTEEKIRRELVKSFIGFQGSPLSKSSQTIPIITGNWGCGVFKGDPQLKLLIQWLSASLLSRRLIYCTFKDKKLVNCREVIELIKNKQIKNVFDAIMQYSKKATKHGDEQLGVFDYLKTLLK